LHNEYVEGYLERNNLVQGDTIIEENTAQDECGFRGDLISPVALV